MPNVKELKTLLDENREALEEETGYHEPWSALLWNDVDFPVKVAPGVSITEVVSTHGGHEGGGEETWIVFVVNSDDGEQLFRKSGSYYSYDGTSWDGALHEVASKQKTITVYERIN